MDSVTSAPVRDRTQRTSAKKNSRTLSRESSLRALNRAADAIDARPAFCIFLVVICFLAMAVAESHSRLLSNDEIYTVHIAQSPTVGRMLALSREIDLHPPLHYFLQRYALMLPFPRWFDARLPSILAGLVACLTIMAFVSRRLGPLFGVVAVVAMWFSQMLAFSWSNRPYMLWLVFLCLLLPARTVAVRLFRPWWSVPAVFLLALAMVMSHLIGVLCLGPFFMAEAYRAWRNRRIDWLLVLAFTLPMLVALGFHYQIAHLSKDAFPTQQMPSLALAIETYVVSLGTSLQVFGIILLLLLILFGPGAAVRSYATTRQHGIPFNMQERIILYGLLILPLFTLLAGSFIHVQFWTRYGAAALPAIAILAAAYTACCLPFARPMAFLIVLSGVVFSAFLILTDTPVQTNAWDNKGGRNPIPLATLDSSLPIVTASPMTFIEMSDREKPAIVNRVYYLTDIEQAKRFAHYTLFENEDKIRALLNLHSNAEPLITFLPEHHRFYVIGDYGAPQIWLLRCLAAWGLHLDYLGKYESSYESQDLYLVWH